MVQLDETLDVAGPQILLYSGDDAHGVRWHHRVLLCRATAGVWLGLSPDLEIERIDLNESVHEVLDRRGGFPEYIDPEEIYAFDPVSDAFLQPYRRRARLQAALLGDSVDAGDVTRHVWVVSDRSSPSFGQEIDRRLFSDPSTGIALESHGVVMIGGAEMFVEKVDVADLEAWRGKQRDRDGDERTLGDHRDGAERRLLSLSEAVALMRESDLEGFPFDGVRAAKEFHQSVALGPGNMSSYHSEWLRLSSVGEISAVSYTHQYICELLRLLHS